MSQETPYSAASSKTLISSARDVQMFISLLFTYWEKLSNRCPCPGVVASVLFRAKYSSDSSNQVAAFPLSSEVAGLARSDLIRCIHALGGAPVYHAPILRKSNEKVSVSLDSCVLYLRLNPRNQIEALSQLFTEVNDSERARAAFPNHAHAKRPLNLQASLPSVMSRPKGQVIREFIEIDVDTLDKMLIAKFFFEAPILSEKVQFTIRTRGGYHFVFLQRDFPHKLVHRVTEMPEFRQDKIARDGKLLPSQPLFEVHSDPQVPVPGTLQGGFPVRLVSDLEEEFPELAPLHS